MLNRYIQQFFTIAILATCFLFPLQAAVDYHIEDQPQVIEKVVQFDQKGILKQKPNGYLYVEVSNDFISHILPLIDIAGKIVPPHNFTSKNGIGAHISVIYENEFIINRVWEIKELGQEFTFSITEIRTVNLKKNNKTKKLWLLAVEAPELEQLRMNYGLSPKLKGHDFHITLGSQYPEKLQKEESNSAVEYKEAA